MKLYFLLISLNSLRVYSYPWAAQRAGGQTSGGSTDAAGSVYRVKKNDLREFQKVQVFLHFHVLPGTGG